MISRNELIAQYEGLLYNSGNQIKNSEMGGACGTFGKQVRYTQGFGGETWGKEAAWETQT